MTRRNDQHGHWRVSALAGWNSMKAPSVKLPLLHRGKAGEPPGIVAVARVDQRTKNITKRLSPGEIAIIDHSDLDRVSAEELIRRKVAAVVNASVSITGRYPTSGRSCCSSGHPGRRRGRGGRAGQGRGRCRRPAR
jgi:hypothetical protein